MKQFLLFDDFLGGVVLVEEFTDETEAYAGGLVALFYTGGRHILRPKCVRLAQNVGDVVGL